MTSTEPVDPAVAGAPPLTSEQIITLRRLLNPPSAEVVQMPRRQTRQRAA